MATDTNPDTPDAAVLKQRLTGIFDAAWYAKRYPDVIAAKMTPLAHFLDHGVHEWREPNPFFRGTWSVDHYPDVAASGPSPSTHPLETGAAELRKPHPRFNATWYVDQHPEAADNPLLYHIKT